MYQGIHSAILECKTADESLHWFESSPSHQNYEGRVSKWLKEAVQQKLSRYKKIKVRFSKK